MPMIICVSGLTASGKDTIADMLAKRLELKHVKRSYKEFVGDNEKLISFDKKVKHSFDLKFDKEIIREANRSDSVVSTSLGPWIVKNSNLNVWLAASFETRVRRVMQRRGEEKMSLKQARRYVTKKDRTWSEHVRKTYKIDIINDHDVFDMELNSDRLSKEEIIEAIATLSLAKGKTRFR